MDGTGDEVTKQGHGNDDKNDGGTTGSLLLRARTTTTRRLGARSLPAVARQARRSWEGGGREEEGAVASRLRLRPKREWVAASDRTKFC